MIQIKNRSISSFRGLVSVGIPTYRRPEMLRRALKIITEQTYKNLEIIISDNDSDSLEALKIVAEFSEYDSRIKYFQQSKNVGVLANAEFVLNKARGEFFTWFSDDDWRSPEFVGILVNELELHPGIEFAFCDYREAYVDGSYAQNYPSSHLKFFKPFENRIRFIRVASYYWQNSINGKQNLFYSLFRRDFISRLDIKKLTNGYSYLNMDSLIVFNLLQKSAVSICPERMCVLTCGNKKYYEDEYEIAKSDNKSYFTKLWNFICEHTKEVHLYSKNTDSILEKIVIYLLFYPKILNILFRIFMKKFPRNKRSPKNTNSKNSEVNINLPNVTLIAMATKDVDATLEALRYSSKSINFGSIKLISHYTPFGLDGNINFYRIDKIKSIDEWSYKIIYELNEYVETDFALLVHADGFVVNPNSWRKEFFEYDYIGAPWPLPKDSFSYRDISGNIVRAGNSVSLRSKRLLEFSVLNGISWESDHGFYNEDGFICVKNRHLYEAAGMKIADLDMAKYFSHESMIPEVRGIRPFVFHKWKGSNSKYPKFY